jgi:signal peptidase II
VLAVVASLALAAGVVGADQATKRRVVARLAPGRTVVLTGGIRLAHLVNRRGGLVAVGLPWAWALWAAIGAVALWAVAAPGSGPAAVAGVGLVLGGGAGNLVDRTARGGVVDFIAVGRWPTFNLADAAIVAGAVLALGAAVAVP